MSLESLKAALTTGVENVDFGATGVVVDQASLAALIAVAEAVQAVFDDPALYETRALLELRSALNALRDASNFSEEKK